MTPEILTLDPKTDSRGWLLKVLMRGQLDADHRFGEIYMVSAVPGQTRACHYHEVAREWFCLVQGRAILKLRDIESGNGCEITLDGAAPVCVAIPARTAHSIEAVGEGPALLLAYADQPYDPMNTDTFPFDM